MKQKAVTARKTDIFNLGGVLIPVAATPWCDCSPRGFGFRKRDDGCWVRPCCNRRERYMWERYGDEPITFAAVNAARTGATS